MPDRIDSVRRRAARVRPPPFTAILAAGKNTVAECAASTKGALKQLALGTTEACNLRCVKCPFHGSGSKPAKPRATLSPPVVESVLAQLPASVDSLLFSGTGELTADAHFPEHLKKASQRGMTSTVITNAQLLDEEKVKRLLRDTGLRHVVLRVDSIDPEEFAWQRPPSSLEHTVVRPRQGCYRRHVATCEA